MNRLVEQEVAAALGEILRRINSAGRAKQEKDEEEKELENLGLKLWTGIHEVLTTRGNRTHTKVIDDQHVSYLTTPPVEVTIGKEKVPIFLIENVHGNQDHIRHDNISIRAFGPETSDKELFCVYKDGRVTNWSGEQAKKQEISQASWLVSYIGESLPINA